MTMIKTPYCDICRRIIEHTEGLAVKGYDKVSETPVWTNVELENHETHICIPCVDSLIKWDQTCLI